MLKSVEKALAGLVGPGIRILSKVKRNSGRRGLRARCQVPMIVWHHAENDVGVSDPAGLAQGMITLEALQISLSDVAVGLGG
jgi:hypothetical protein